MKGELGSHLLWVMKLPLGLQNCLVGQLVNRGKKNLDEDLALSFLEGDKLQDHST